MDIVYNLLVVLHFLGLASLIGGWMVQLSARERVVNSAMLHGVYTQLVTGIALVGLAEGVDSLDREIDNAKIGVKLAVALVIAIFGWLNRKRTAVSDWIFYLIATLSVVNVVIAVFWT
ncbi:MAG TPA: hypothetical protein VFZ37_05735 [Jiangellaceae bacterium]